MTKLKIDYKAINNKVLPNIDNSMGEIGDALNNIGTIYVPSDFTYASYVYNLPGNIESIKSELKTKRDTISTTSTNYSKIESTNYDDLDSMKITELEYRKLQINSNKT